MAHLVTAVKGIILDLRSFTRSCDDIGIVRGKFFGILLTRGQNAYALWAESITNELANASIGSDQPYTIVVLAQI